jgi:hypothetical protein
MLGSDSYRQELRIRRGEPVWPSAAPTTVEGLAGLGAKLPDYQLPPLNELSTPVVAGQ